jgi:hypothetical protein
MDNNTGLPAPFFWIVWLGTFLTTIAAKANKFILDITPIEVIIPEHDIWYLPKTKEAIPAMILAIGCAILSWMIKKLFDHLWRKVRR